MILFFLLAVVAVAHYGGVLYAVPVGVVSIQAFDWYFLPPLRDLDAQTVVLLGLFLVMSVLVGATTARAGRRAAASEAARGVLAEEQAALRRVATLVARGLPATKVFAAVAEEIGRLVSIDAMRIARYESDGSATAISGWTEIDEVAANLQTGERLTLDGQSVTALVFRTGRPARMDSYANATGSLATALREAGVRSSVGAPILVDGRLWGVLAAASTQPEPLPVGMESRLAEFTDLVATAIANAEARSEIGRLAEEQAALRRVATLVARGVQPGEVFAAVAEEIGRVLDVRDTEVVRYESDATATNVAIWGDANSSPVGSNWTLEGDSVIARVFHTGRSARIDTYGHATGEIAAAARRLGKRSTVAAPIVIDDRLWGAAVANSASGPLAAAAEERIANFTELIGIAISNAEARSELAASRARVVAAGDETRRRLERDLHDGIQQRLVSLALKARATETMSPELSDDVQSELSLLADGLGSALDDLREISRGIHPAILSEAGLGPALKALARRSTVPIVLDLQLDSPLEEPVEVAAYYVASEALTNAVKHAQASVVELHVDYRDGTLTLSIRDDGVGGADPTRGSGIVGLVDRAEALGGKVSMVSTPGDGTRLHVQLPANRSAVPRPPRVAPSTAHMGSVTSEAAEPQ